MKSIILGIMGVWSKLSLVFIFSLLSLTACHKPKKHFSGYTDTLYVYLSSPSAGYLKKIYIERGQQVHAADLIAELGASPEKYELALTKANLQQARHTLKDMKLPKRLPELMAIENQIKQTETAVSRVEAHLNRLLKLEKKQFIDPDTIDNQTKTLKELNYQVKQYQENLKLAHMGARKEQIKAQQFLVRAALAKRRESQWYLRHKNVSAPADGYVFDMFYTEGEWVAAQKSIAVMVTPKNHFIEFFVSAKELSSLELGMPLTYQLYGEKQSHAAHISYISQTVEYMPPVLYTPDYQEELVFRVRAKPQDDKPFILGQPVDIWI
jgi:HlyD family secretion protein